MTPQEIEALESVIEYLWSDEERDYADCEPSDRVGHIYLALKTLKDYVDQCG